METPIIPDVPPSVYDLPIDNGEWVFGLPTTAKVLGKTFNLKVLVPGQNEDVDGLMCLSRQEIWVRLLHAKEQSQDSMLHELIHAVDESLCLGMRERQVFALAAGLLAVLKDNPALTEWILK